ncbi:hypothetical protein EST38_g4100 [Candolleomyces aberdarensis]|uniref:Uncharacterized protein n=1 Tax=Candolleomyces aberdarensis TaxID=2316362 RepID=A0A4Q2DP30_9AGAR|nr:hypothetical protein EST38_g4100 [Candolleomyces aberdarensis]
MHSRRTPAVSPLAIVLPHPPLPRRRPSHLSLNSNGSQPQTPRSCGSPATSAIFFTPSRRSTDSWNSSNADELEWEWKPDQVLLLSRTLDALPAHLVTPFNGPIPPPNLLDKIARGVSKAKGPTEWPHSVRATRVKLIELSRSKAKDEALAEQRRNQIPEEPEVEIADESNYSYEHDGVDHPLGIGARRPLYRQSSMDFLDSAGTDLKKNDNIARRLQRSDRAFPNPGYHPYSRRNAHAHRRSSSPPPLTKVPSLISPSTQSSDTLDSFDSFDTDPGAKRRSLSSLSSMSVISMGSSGIAIPDPRVQRIRRSESVSMGAPLPPPKDRTKPSSGLKRAPSYGAMAQETRREHIATKVGHVRRDSGSYPSSDEEEKQRTKQAKKQRTKTPESPAARPSVSPSSKSPSSKTKAKNAALDTPPPLPEKDRTYVRSRTKVVSPAKPQDENVQVPASPIKMKKVAQVEGAKRKHSERRAAPMSLQRNPSMFGPELPQLPVSSAQNVPLSPVRPRGGLASAAKVTPPSPAPAPLSPLILSPSMHIVPTSPMSPSPKTKTLRRVKRIAPARRISFGSLIGDEDGQRPDPEQRSCLGSAFQLL